MLRLTHHGDGLVHGALVAVLLIVAVLPVVAVGVAGGGVGEEVVSEGNLPRAIRVVASRDDHDIVRRRVEVGLGARALGEEHEAIVVFHVCQRASEVVFMHLQGDFAVDERTLEVVPFRTFGRLHFVLGHHVHDPVHGFEESIGFRRVVVLAVLVHLNEASAVGNESGGNQVRGEGHHGITVNHAVVVGVAGQLFAERFKGFPRPFALCLKVVDLFGVNTGIVEQALVEEHALAGFSLFGAHTVDAAVLAQQTGNRAVPLLVGEVEAVQRGQVIEQTRLEGREVRAGAENPNIVLVAARGREVGEVGGRVVPSRGVALHNLEVVGLFQPSAVVVGRFARRCGGFVVVPVGRPPVADGDFHAAEVDDVAVRVAVDDDTVILVGVFDVFCDCQRQGAENHHQREKQSKVPFHEIASFYFMTSGS